MQLFRASAAGIAAEALAGTLDVRITENFRHRHGYTPTVSEQRSWQLSLPILARDLIDAGLGEVEVLVEWHLPMSSLRVDAILAGAHPRTGQPSYVLVELKQWTHASRSPAADDLVRVEGYGERDRLHPCEQVRAYCTQLADFMVALADQPDALAGAAYLHNADEHAVATLRDLRENEYGRLFTASTRGRFLNFLRSRLVPTSGASAADLLTQSAAAPSRKLLAVAADEIRDRQQFVLLDEQQVAFSLVCSAVQRSFRGATKEAVVVTGGPGSGKSVIALSLLGHLARQGRRVMHATGSKSFTTTLKKVAGHRKPPVQALFRYFNNFISVESNGLDVLICDEAHRMRETSEHRFTKAAHRTGRPQVDELLSAARVPVFLLDQHQVVRPGELGTVAEVRAAAARLGIQVHQVDLTGQFRCGGSEAYVEWVLRLLGLRPGGPAAWEGDPSFEVRVAASPDDMESFLAERQEAGYVARMSAGFCWPWSKPRKDGTLVPDVVVGDWQRPWNVHGDRRVREAPPSSLWASDPNGFGQVGCIYTAQGFEYDWAGVILGPDLLWRGGRWVTNRAANADQRLKQASEPEFEVLVRNVYKVLLTRGMVGTVVHAVDPETQQLLESLVVRTPEPAHL